MLSMRHRMSHSPVMGIVALTFYFGNHFHTNHRKDGILNHEQVSQVQEIIFLYFSIKCLHLWRWIRHHPFDAKKIR